MLTENDLKKMSRERESDNIISRKNSRKGYTPEQFPEPDPEEIFNALPNVNEIWIVGLDHYLDDSKGGKKYTRSEVEQLKSDSKKDKSK